MTLNNITFADMARREKGGVFMRCDESFITMKLIWHSYLILSLGNCAYKIPTETDLSNSYKDASNENSVFN